MLSHVKQEQNNRIEPLPKQSFLRVNYPPDKASTQKEILSKDL